PSILKNDEQTIGIGSPGGKRIPAVMSDMLTRYLLIGDDWENAIDDSRFYIEDDKIYTEEELDTDIQAQLRQIGYEIYNIRDRKSTRLNSSHVSISYAVFCLKKKIELTRCDTAGTSGH